MPYICAVIPQPSGTLSTDQGKQRPGWITLLGATGHPVADSNEWSAEMEYYSSALLWCFCFGFSALLLLLRFSALLLTSLAFSPFFFPSLSSCLAAFPRSASWYSYFFLSCFSLCSFCMSLLCVSSCIFFCYAAFCQKNIDLIPLCFASLPWTSIISHEYFSLFEASCWPFRLILFTCTILICFACSSFFSSLFWTFSYHLKPVSVCSLPVCLSFCCTFLPVTCFSFQPAPKRTTIATTTINI